MEKPSNFSQNGNTKAFEVSPLPHGPLKSSSYGKIGKKSMALNELGAKS